MKHTNRWIAVALLVGGLQLAACKQNAAVVAPVEDNGPVKVERMEGIDPTKVILTQEAAQRLDIQTATVRDADVKGVKRKVIPYAAVLYDTDGATWTYTSPEPLTYVRHPIKVDFIQGEDAVLADDLPSGTNVVIIGSAELYGSETEFAEE